MASSIQILRSTTAQERPLPGNLLEGQPAANINASEPGLFFKASNGTVFKIGPAAVTSDGSAPNSSPAGQTGNCIGELWLDKSLTPPVLKVFDGTDWVDAGSGGGGGGAGSFIRWIYTASGGETSLSGQSGGVTLQYTPGLEEVFVNGVLITRGVDYSATDGSSITSLQPLTAGDVVTVVSVIPLDTVYLPGEVTLLRWAILATAGQTLLSGDDLSGQPLAYTSGFEQVYINGVLQTRGTDYTATNGSSIQMANGLALNDEVTVLAFSEVQIGGLIDTENIVNSAVTSPKLDNGAVTTEKLANAAVSAQKLENLAVTAQKLDNGAVTNAKVSATAEILTTKLSHSASGSSGTPRLVSAVLDDVINVKDFGATGNGSDDDTTAIQNAANHLKSVTNTYSATLYFPPGEYKITAPIDFSASGGERMEIIGGGGTLEVATISVSYHGYGPGSTDTGAFFFSSDPAGSYGREFSVSGFLFQRASSGFRTPCAIEALGAAQSRINNITVGSWSNTCFRFDSPQNCRVFNLTSFSGGNSFPYKDASAVTVTQSGNTLTASSSIFTATDVNKWIGIWGTGSSSYRRRAKIASYVSPVEVTLDQSVTDTTPRRLLFGSPFATLSSASKIVTADANCFSANDVGLQVWFRYQSGGHVFRSKIDSYISPTQVTVEDFPPASTTTAEFGCAAMEVYTSGNIFGSSSDNKFVNLQIENHDGIGVCIQDASVLEMVPAKIHSEQSATVNRYSISAMWINQADGFYSGSFDAQYLGVYKLWASGQTAAFTFADLNCRTARDEKLFGIGPKNAFFDGGVLVLDNVAVFGANPDDGIKDVVEDQNATTPGYTITGTFINQGDPSDYVVTGHLSPNAFVADPGSAPTFTLESTNRSYSIKSHGGSGFNRLTFRDETAGSDRLYLYSSGAFGPEANGTQDLGLTTARWGDAFLDSVYVGSGSAQVLSGSGTPEGSVTAAVGSIFLRTDGGAGTTLYVKQSGAGSTGWAAK